VPVPPEVVRVPTTLPPVTYRCLWRREAQQRAAGVLRALGVQIEAL
jgi:hypothetical protein